MNTHLLVHSPPIILLHFTAALLAILTGAWQLLAAKGNTDHRWRGRLWVALMLIITGSSFAIRTLTPDSPLFGYSPIHLLSVFVIYQLWMGVKAARAGRIGAHQRHMAYTYVAGLLIAGVFTLVPGRLLYRAFIAPHLTGYPGL